MSKINDKNEEKFASASNLINQINQRKQEKTKSVIGRYTKRKPEEEQSKEITSDKKESEKNSKNKQDGFTTSFIFKYEFEDILHQIRRRLSRKYRIRISKTDAIEMGFLLLQHADDEILKKITEKKDFETNVVEALRQVLEEKS